MEKKYKFYKFYVNKEKNEIIAVTHYGNKTIRGIAKCNPEDTFDVEYGKKLAVARAEVKVAKAKIKNASAAYLKASVAADEAQRKYDKMKQYYMDSVDQFDNAMAEVDKVIKEIM